MRNLFRFIKKYHFILLFILIESFSLFLFFSNHKFQKSRFLSFTQEYTGAIYSYYSNFNEYLHLNEENEYLKRENAKLYSVLSKSEKNTNPQLFEFTNARIVNNSIFKKDNYLTLDKGELDGIKIGMGIMVENGVIGIVNSISLNYSKAISILNSKSSISVMHFKSNQNGSLKWRSDNYMSAEINDIPNHANINIGDTIQTNGYSSIFPSGINVGTITSYKKGSENGLYNIKIRFINDMNKIKNVYIINSLDKLEKENL